MPQQPLPLTECFAFNRINPFPASKSVQIVLLHPAFWSSSLWFPASSGHLLLMEGWTALLPEPLPEPLAALLLSYGQARSAERYRLRRGGLQEPYQL